MADQRRGGSENALSKATQARTSEQGQNPQPRVRCIGGLHGPRDASLPERETERRDNADLERTFAKGTRSDGTAVRSTSAARGAVQRWAFHLRRAVKTVTRSAR